MRIFLLLIGLGWIALTPPSSGDCCNGADGLRCRVPTPAQLPAGMPVEMPVEISVWIPPKAQCSGLPAELCAVDDGGLQGYVGPVQAAD